MQKLTSVTLLLFLAASLFGQATRPSSKPFVLGVTETLRSNVLKEDRTLNIYLPEGYDPADTTRYSVIYLLDGAADEDFIHVVGLVHFNTFSWINRIPKSIVVGIANTDRQRDFTYPTTVAAQKERFKTTGGSANFLAFLEKELQPHIAKNYRVNASKTLIGQSLGGLLATEILLKKPALFDKYIIISPSLWWDNASLLTLDSELLREGFSKKTDIYIGVGKEGVVPGGLPRVMEVDANLLADRLRSGKSKAVTVHFDYLPDEDHATAGHQAVFNAFRMLYPATTGK